MKITEISYVKPQPTALGIPGELWADICLANTAKQEWPEFLAFEGTKDGFIIDSTDFFNLRLACLELEKKTRHAFGQRFFTSRKFMLTPWSLKALSEISLHSTFSKSLRELSFGPERLTGYALKRPIEDIDEITTVQGFGGWTYRAPLRIPPTWETDFSATFTSLREEQAEMEVGYEDERMLLDVFQNLPNLKIVTVEMVPCLRFNQGIRINPFQNLGWGARALFRQVG
ncbi:uncharacterized protein BDR25DRAFT_207935, partial [Lindgomyces ingoldianus]